MPRSSLPINLPHPNYPRSLTLTNAHLSLTLTADFGPRLLRLHYHNSPNLLGELTPQQEDPHTPWHNYGGHRLWHAPESNGRTNLPEDDPAELHHNPADPLTATLCRPADAAGIVREIHIQLHPTAPTLTLTHRLTNRNLWHITLAPWAITVVASGSQAILPLPAPQAHHAALLPVTQLSLWAYTRLNDPRLQLGERFIRLQHDPNQTTPLKIGAYVPQGWLAALNGEYALVKTFGAQPNQPYPDNGCNAELFVNPHILELESLAPLQTLAPGQTATHIEHWHILSGLPPMPTETGLLTHLLPRIQSLA